MKWTEMLSCSPETLREHYAGVRALAYNNANMAQCCRDGGSTIKKLARQMGYLMTQVSMCENAARKRNLALA